MSYINAPAPNNVIIDNDAKIVKPIIVAIFSVLLLLYVVFMLFVFVSTNMRTFEQTNVKPMLRNR